MKACPLQPSRSHAFTLLEVVIVLAITALVLSAVYSIAQGTLTLADDVRRAERRDTRKQAFTSFCEHLLTTLPATGTLNLTTRQERGQYLTRLELQHVHSPFDDTTDCTVTLLTQGQPGGGMSLLLSCQPASGAKAETSAVLFDDLALCEWSVFDKATQTWATFWQEDSQTTPPTAHQHPPLIKLAMEQSGTGLHDQVFWIAPAEAVSVNPTQTLR